MRSDSEIAPTDRHLNLSSFLPVALFYRPLVKLTLNLFINFFPGSSVFKEVSLTGYLLFRSLSQCQWLPEKMTEPDGS